jgi:hypothetical protein
MVAYGEPNHLGQPDDTMNRRHKAQIGFSITIAAALAGLLFGLFGGPYSFELTRDDIQPRINAQLPKTVKGVTVHSADVELSDKLRIDFTLTGVRSVPVVGGLLGVNKKLEFAMSATVVGTPRYDSERSAFFLDPKSVEITHFERINANPAAVDRFIARIVKSERWRGRIDEYRKEFGEDLTQWLQRFAEAGAKGALERFPVYTIKDDGFLGKKFWTSALLHSIDVRDGKLVVQFTLVKITAMVIILAILVMISIAVLFVIARSPGWGTDPLDAASLLPDL